MNSAQVLCFIWDWVHTPHKLLKSEWSYVFAKQLPFTILDLPKYLQSLEVYAIYEHKDEQNIFTVIPRI